MTAGRVRALRVVGYGAVLVLLVLFARQVPWRAVLRAARTADLWLLLVAATLNLLSLAAKGVRWWVFLRRIGVRSLSLVLRATFAGASLNNLVVAQGGEGARVLLVARGAGVSSAGVLAALAIERAFDALSYLALLVTAAWLLPLPAAILRWRGAASVALAVVTIALVVLLQRARGATRHDAEAGGGDRSRLAAYARRFRTVLRTTVSPASFASGAALSVVAWLLQIATYHLVARAAHAPLPVAGSIAALLAVGVSFLLRATPGNVGIFQVVYALTVAPFGVPRADAIAVAVLIQMVQVGPTLLAGLLASALVARNVGTRRVVNTEVIDAGFSEKP